MWALAALAIAFEVLGIISAVRAVMEVRTPQGAVAWAIALIAFPFVAVPAYWVFGRSRFQGFVAMQRDHLAGRNLEVYEYLERLGERGLLALPDRDEPLVVEKLVRLPATTGNEVELLINGEATFASILAGIERARDYVLVQFYILRADGVGNQLKNCLIERAHAGVRCHLLFDEVGSLGLTRAYLGELRDAGVQVRPFNTRKGRTNRFQVNFRNHRKIVVVDGQEAWVGGLNVGDEYLGLDPKIGFWRDTHLRLAGPVVQSVQVSFLEDWSWAADEVLQLSWDPRRAGPEARAIAHAVPTGPADSIETCTLFFVGLIHRAEHRLWIASPYFVPDQQFVTALQLAAIRGVDVRIIIPETSDNPMVGMSHWSYLESLEAVGIRVYRHQKGFMHQKVVLVDHEFSTVGTANFDNRSFRLNFEITVAVADRDFNRAVGRMLEDDMADSEPMTLAELQARPFWFRFLVRLARLAAPVQ
jgi:cardiolipin synthase